MYNNHFELIGDDHFVNFLMDQQQSNFAYVNSSSFMQCQNSDDEGPNQQEFFSSCQLPQQTQVKKQQKKKKSDDTILTSKQNLKNTYINKITSLIQESKPTMNHKFERKVSTNTDDSNQAKLIRNRECARNSRKRKKIYLELLENRVNTLKEELEKCKRIIKGHSNCMQQIGSNPQLQNFFVGRQQLFDKLESAVQNNSDNNDINLLLDSMRFRVGGGGKERVNASNYFLQQIMEISFPIHVKYLLWASGSNLTEPTWLTNLSQEINITDQQMKSLKKSYKRIQSDKEKLEDIIKKFQTVKENLYQKTNSLENFIDEMRSILTPTQVAKFLLGLEKNKFQKELSMSNLWKQFEDEFDIEIKQEECQFDDTVIKKVHL
ncbi:unnamed protein product [Paramecium primaurelia]|uniref:BZIP domain-containing protein n=1 Tax=Paramecium primaurelia TaxID=5886 RepID=A0A8S1QJA7_PARPR|nr:unnamed protein product [Paramecium primaurelia]